MTIFNTIGLFIGIALFFLLISLFWFYRNVRQFKEARLIARMRIREERKEAQLARGMAKDEKAIWLSIAPLRKVHDLLEESGIDISWSNFLLLAAGLFFSVLLVTLLLLERLIPAFLAGGMALGGLLLFVNIKHQRRIKVIEEQFPKALELMVIGLRAGHTLEESIHLAATQITPPLAIELGRAYEEYELGRPITEALSGLAIRLNACRSIHIFVESVLVLKQTGGNLVEIIEQIIESIRNQAAYEIRYRAMTAEGRTSGKIIGGLPIIIIVALMFLNPEFMNLLFFDSAGHIVLLISGILWALGLVWIYRLIRPAV